MSTRFLGLVGTSSNPVLMVQHEGQTLRVPVPPALRGAVEGLQPGAMLPPELAQQVVAQGALPPRELRYDNNTGSAYNPATGSFPQIDPAVGATATFPGALGAGEGLLSGVDETPPAATPALALAAASSSGPDFREMARRIAEEEGIDPELFLRLVQQESSFRPGVVSSAGAIGLAQLMPGTARELGVDPWDPEQNLRGGARYFRQQLDRFGTVPLALAAYNAGPGRVEQYGGIPPFRETQRYVQTVAGTEEIPQRAEGSPSGEPLNPVEARFAASGGTSATGSTPATPSRDPAGTEEPAPPQTFSERLMAGLDDLPEAMRYLELPNNANQMRVGAPPPINPGRRGDLGKRALQRFGLASLA
jgi:hypothetical protein